MRLGGRLYIDFPELDTQKIIENHRFVDAFHDFFKNWHGQTNYEKGWILALLLEAQAPKNWDQFVLTFFFWNVKF